MSLFNQPDRAAARRGAGGVRAAILGVLLAAFNLTALAPAIGQQPDEEQASDPLAAALAEHRYALELTDQATLAGPGAELLIREGEASQFFLIGEEHGIAEIPRLASALFRELAPAGYGHLAVEIGFRLAAKLESLAREPSPERALIDFYDAHPPGAPFFNLEEEARLIVEAVAASERSEGVIWGLDYDIVGDRYTLRRLAELAAGPEAERAVREAIELADRRFLEALESGDPGASLMFGGPDSVFVALREAYDPPPGSEADRILELLSETVKINDHWVNGRVWESNHRRARFNKRKLAELYHTAAESAGRPPRGLFKFGAYHVMRGRTFTNVFDIGTLAASIAEAHGSKSFHLLAAGGAGTERTQFDVGELSWKAVPVDAAAAEWAAPLFDLAEGRGWTLFDLRPLRPLLDRGDLGDVPPQLARVIFGYDAFLILGGSTPAHPLPIDLTP